MSREQGGSGVKRLALSGLESVFGILGRGL